MTHMSMPKNCMSRSFAALVLLLRNALTSSMSWMARDTNDMDKTVEPELYSTTVFVCPGTTHFCNRLRARNVGEATETEELGARTWHGLDVVCGMHRHHLGVDADSIFPEGVQAVGDLHEGQWGRRFWIKVLLDRVGPFVHVEGIWARHGVKAWLSAA